jgi:hypothetical protein
MFDSTVCAVCILLLIAWIRDNRRNSARRRCWICAGMTLDEQLEIRRHWLEENARGYAIACCMARVASTCSAATAEPRNPSGCRLHRSSRTAGYPH